MKRKNKIKYLLLCLPIFLILIFFYNSNIHQNPDPLFINDISGLNSTKVKQVLVPKSTQEIIQHIVSSSGAISVGGGRYSQGGQIAYPNSVHFDMRQFDQIIHQSGHEIRVQAGATWRKIQEYIDPLDLSIHTMQSYADFTVGGSLSVNAHGRYVGHGPLVNSVLSIQMVLADGSLIIAGPNINTDIFYAAIGGYGGLGIITEVTLQLEDNQKIERKTQTMKISAYKDYFFQQVRNNQDIIFHNAIIYPPEFENVRSISEYVTDKELTNPERLMPKDRNYFWEPKLVDLISSSNFTKWIRQHILDPLYFSKERVVWRNWEASLNVKELEPKSREKYTYLLREYFVPVYALDQFYPKMRSVFQKYAVNVLNISIRHAPQDSKTLLAWAKEEVFAFVLYYKQEVNMDAIEASKKWDREMMDIVLELGGTYYLPYQINASKEQFFKAYPRAEKYFQLKKKLDPNNRFPNKLWEFY